MSKFFDELNSINVNEFTEKKGQFTYLSWAWAVRELLKVDPDASWVVHKWGGDDDVNSRPYMETESGYFVQVTVNVGGVDRTQIHPVLDNRNQTLEKPNAFQINTSIQRCLAKAIALHGLGLYLFAGEDLPQIVPLTKDEIKAIQTLLADIDDVDFGQKINNMIDEDKIHKHNYKVSLKQIMKKKD